MLLYDISSTIAPDMPVYKNRDEKRPRFTVSRDHVSGTIYEGRLDFDLHSGTHIDLPLHVLPQGETSDAWKSEQFLTRCRVLDFSALAADRIGQAICSRKKMKAGPKLARLFGRRAVLYC
jgi:arylformamidase